TVTRDSRSHVVAPARSRAAGAGVWAVAEADQRRPTVPICAAWLARAAAVSAAALLTQESVEAARVGATAQLSKVTTVALPADAGPDRADRPVRSRLVVANVIVARCDRARVAVVAVEIGLTGPAGHAVKQAGRRSAAFRERLAGAAAAELGAAAKRARQGHLSRAAHRTRNRAAVCAAEEGAGLTHHGRRARSIAAARDQG